MCCIIKPPSVNEVEPEANKANLSAINKLVELLNEAVPATVKLPVIVASPEISAFPGTVKVVK